MATALLIAAYPAGVARADQGGDDEIDRAVADKRVDDAVLLLGLAWTEGGNDAERSAAIALRAGHLSSTTGDRAAALRWFTLAMAIDPAARLPAGTSRETAHLLAGARAALGGRRFGARRAGRGVQVDDPLGVIFTVRAARRSAGVDNGRAALPARPGDVIELVDHHGNVLWSGARRLSRATAASPPARDLHRSPRSDTSSGGGDRGALIRLLRSFAALTN